MDETTWNNYMSALDGTLQSVPNGNPFTATIWNSLPIAIRIAYVTPAGVQANMGVVPAGYSVVVDTAVGDYFILKAAATGSMVGVVSIATQVSMVFFDPSDLLGPNDLGPPPTPDSQYILPLDTPRVVVGVGIAPSNNIALREQYWMRAPDSFSILPGERQDISTTTTTAMQRTSSSLDTISASLGTSASAGWGPLSASVSASLSVNSTSFQEVSVNEERQNYTADHVQGSGETASYFLKWQLMDLITVVELGTGAVLASMVSGQAPVLSAGPYTIGTLPSAARPRAAGKFYPRNRLPVKRALRARSAREQA